MLLSHMEVRFMQNEVKYSPLAVRLPVDIRQKLEKRAKEERRSLSNMVIKILESELKDDN